MPFIAQNSNSKARLSGLQHQIVQGKHEGEERSGELDGTRGADSESLAVLVWILSGHARFDAAAAQWLRGTVVIHHGRFSLT